MATERNVVESLGVIPTPPRKELRSTSAIASLNGVGRMAASTRSGGRRSLPYAENGSAAYEPKENRLEKAASHPDVQGRLREETPRSCRSTLGGTRLRPSRSGVRCRC